MDPNANLAEQKRAITRINAIRDQKEGPTMGQLRDLQYEAYRLAELAEAMSEWIAGGGFLPDAWKQIPSESATIPAP